MQAHSTDTDTHTSTHACMHAHTHTHTHTNMNTHMCMHTQTHTHTHTHTDCVHTIRWSLHAAFRKISHQIQQFVSVKVWHGLRYLPHTQNAHFYFVVKHFTVPVRNFPMTNHKTHISILLLNTSKFQLGTFQWQIWSTFPEKSQPWHGHPTQPNAFKADGIYLGKHFAALHRSS